MTSIGTSKVLNAILCDDIRAEAATNKHILIGTLSGDIKISGDLPAVIQLGLYVELWVPVGSHEIDIRFSGPGKGEAIIKGVISQREDDYANLIVPRMNVLMEREGVFRVDSRVADGRWVNLVKKRVSAAPTDSPQPSELSLPAAQEA